LVSSARAPGQRRSTAWSGCAEERVWQRNSGSRTSACLWCVSRPPALDHALPVGLTSSRMQVLLSLLYVPRAMNTCMSRIDPFTRKISRLGCGTRTSTRTLASYAPACPHTGRHTCLEPHTRAHTQVREYPSRTQSLSLRIVADDNKLGDACWPWARPCQFAAGSFSVYTHIRDT
jgi:hypothetical protein